jgi:hypothetical protein
LIAGCASLPAEAQNAVDDSYTAAMEHWRAASWYVRLKDDTLGCIETDTFRSEWGRVERAAKPPATYARDARWRETARQVGELGDTAGRKCEDGNLVGTAEALSLVGDALAEARKRAGTQGFPDAMRRLRGQVERLHELLPFEPQRRGGTFDEALRARVTQAATDALLEAERLPKLAPQPVARDDKFKSLIAQNLDGLRNLREALKRGAPGLEVAGQISVVHANYNLLFLNFGA